MTTEVFEYQGYRMPLDLVNLTGGGADTWHDISMTHMSQYRNYCPIEPDHTVLEPGCGIGRDAIQLTKVLSGKGRYIGVDIIKPSIDWARRNISSRFPNFEFHHLNIYSQIHNPGGRSKVTDMTLPVASRSVDRIVLHSVFTHMFRNDIVHYLREFRRVLRPGGLVMTSFFVLDEESRELARKHGGILTFEHPYGQNCWVVDPDRPEGAIGYAPEEIAAMLRDAGMTLTQPIHHGLWCGRTGVTDGQDILVLKPDPRYFPRRVVRKARRTVARLRARFG